MISVHKPSASTTAPVATIFCASTDMKSITACCAASCEFRTTSVDVVPLRYDSPLCIDKKFDPNIRSNPRASTINPTSREHSVSSKLNVGNSFFTCCTALLRIVVLAVFNAVLAVINAAAGQVISGTMVVGSVPVLIVLYTS